jgi:hypothetical protein
MNLHSGACKDSFQGKNYLTWIKNAERFSSVKGMLFFSNKSSVFETQYSDDGLFWSIKLSAISAVGLDANDVTVNNSDRMNNSGLVDNIKLVNMLKI